jgi:hypothetical protein
LKKILTVITIQISLLRGERRMSCHSSWSLSEVEMTLRLRSGIVLFYYGYYGYYG